MKKIVLLFLSVLMISCGASKKTTTTYSKKKTVTVSKNPTLADKIVWTAVSYKGVPYKYSGTTKAGMDCSGLVHTAFKKRNVAIPRTTQLMYKETVPIRINQVKRGDLLFFKTSKRRRQNVNHVGLVTSVKNGNIRFIHSTISNGVIVSSLKSEYWRKTFVRAKRVLK